MAVLAWTLLGLVAGAIVRTVYFDGRRDRTLEAFAAGVVGALLGGFVAVAAGLGSIGTFFDPATWALAIGGALLLGAVSSATSDRSVRGRRGA